MKTSSESKERVSRRKLIDRLVSPTGYGPLRGVVGTTFEFQPEFFETDFLPTLLGLGAWDDRSWTSRIAIEKSLAELEAACVFVDGARYPGRPRSLRVNVHPVVVGAGAILHSKVLLLVHSDAVRLQVASANLTEPGYRKNREVAATIVASKSRPEQASLVLDAVAGMERALGPWWSEASGRVAELARRTLTPWAAQSSPVTDRLLWSGPDGALWRDVLKVWPTRECVERITIVSPFWSEEDATEAPVATLLGALRADGRLARGASIRLMTEAKNLGSGAWQPVLPASFGTFDATTFDVRATAEAVDPSVLSEEIEGEDGSSMTRALHAKVLLLEGPTTSLAYLGSANFSRHGWGFLNGKRASNVEAGLVLLRQGKERAALSALVPKGIGRPVELAGAAAGRLALPSAVEPEPPWPAFLREVRLAPDPAVPDRLRLQVHLEPESVSGPWSLSLDGEETVERRTLLTVTASDQSPRHDLDVSPEIVQRLLRDQQVLVRWWASDAERAFPLNLSIAAREALPLIPGAPKPGESLLLAYYQGQIHLEDLYPDPESPEAQASAGAAADAQHVDTTRIQSYQIREFVEALQGIRDDLKRAARATPPAMRLALQGAVSPLALARAIRAAVEAGERTRTAAAFQLFELVCCLTEARSFAANELHAATWIATVEQTIPLVEGHLAKLREEEPALDATRGSFARYENALRRHFAAGARRT